MRMVVSPPGRLGERSQFGLHGQALFQWNLPRIEQRGDRVGFRGTGAGCQHERGHITDSRFYGHGYATMASRRIFCDVCRYQRWLDVEAALALSQADVGMLPTAVAQDIADAARLELLDLDEVQKNIRSSGHSLVGLLGAFQAACRGDSGQYVHYGATTQDIQDTAQSLELREVLDEVHRLLRLVVKPLVRLAERHGSAPALGRTHAQPALPLGFGVKIASWIDEILRHTERIEAMRPRLLAVQMFGAVGTMAAMGDQGPAVLDRCAQRLGLTVPAIGWHVSRDRVAEFVATLAMVTATMGRVTDEIRLLSRPEFGEVEEGRQHGAIGSSTMPHKRNPEACEQVVALARLATGMVGPALMAMTADGERDARALRIEWACVPDISHYCLAACEITSGVVDRLHVNDYRLLGNVAAVRDEVASETLMLTLAKYLGKQNAFTQVYELIARARTHGHLVQEELAMDAELSDVLSKEDIDQVFDPAHHLGASDLLTARVVNAAKTWLTGDGTP